MQNTKLLQLFKAIKAEELREFTQFLKSPFYNRNQRVISLFEYLRKYRNNLDDDRLNKEYVFKRLFPKGEEYVDWKMRELMSDLSKLIEEYFIVKEVKGDKLEREMLLIKSFDKRQVDDFFFRTAYKLDDQIDALDMKNIEHYIAQLQLQSRLYYHSTTSKFKNKGSRELLSGIMYNTDMFYSLAKLHYGYEIAAWEQIRGERLEGLIPDGALEKLPANVVETNTLLYIYQLSIGLYKFHNSIKDSNKEKDAERTQKVTQKLYDMYNDIKKLIIDNIDKFDKNEASKLITLLINAAGVAISSENTNKEYFSVYKVGVVNEVFTTDDYFPQAHFNNIVTIGCSVGEYEWIQNFINEYYTYLPDEDDKKENIIRLYKATLSFYQEEYEQVEYLLRTLEFEDVSYGLRHYTLLIASLYELKNELHDSCDNFKQYIYRKSNANFIGSDIYERHNNFIKMVLRITNVRGKFRPDVEKLKDELGEMKEITMKIWLNEKITTLGRKSYAAM